MFSSIFCTWTVQRIHLCHVNGKLTEIQPTVILILSDKQLKSCSVFSKNHLQVRSFVFLCLYYSWPKISSSCCNSVSHSSNPAYLSTALKSPTGHSNSWEELQDQRSLYAKIIHSILRSGHIALISLKWANSLNDLSYPSSSSFTFCTETGVSKYIFASFI